MKTDRRNKIVRDILTFVGAAALFLVLSYAFVPEVLGGKVVNQSDISGWKGMAQEALEYNHTYPDDKTAWTNSMFGGMPTVTMYDDFDGDWTDPLYDLLLAGPRPAPYLFVALLGGFLLMLSFGVNRWLAIAGAIAIAFCSYNMQIIQVGHNTKMQAIAFMPWVLAGMVYTYRNAMKHLGEGWKKWLPQTALGATLFALALSFQIKANHPQITYYLAIVILIYAVTCIISLLRGKDAFRKTRAVRFVTASAMLLVIGCIGIATNLNKLIPTLSYAEYSMRGGSELSAESGGGNTGGLSIDYATRGWSYGIEETPNLLIPNFNGGASAGEPNIKSSETEKLLREAGQPNLRQTMKSLPLYWGPQQFTAGPMYMGAVTIFLFILGLCLCDRKEKWWLLTATVIAVFLAWGSHFMWFTRLWFNYVPLYDKFRTVSMALIILQVTLPALGFVVLDRLLKRRFPEEKIKVRLGISTAVTAGFCLLFAIFPGLAGSFTGPVDTQMPDILTEALAADRRAMLVKDAFRSFIFVGMAALLIWIHMRNAAKSGGKTAAKGAQTVQGTGKWIGSAAFVSGAMILLVIFDLFPVGKRYLNKEHFVTRRDFSGQFAQRPVDKVILQDPALDYRVLDVSVNTFNDSHPSYWHKSIGGYSPAKIQRYADLISWYLNDEISDIIRTVNSSATVQEVEESLPSLPITSMLNGKYVIIGGEYPPIVNGNAMGNCWFVDSAIAASSPDEEIALLASTDLRHAAVIGDDFSWAREKIDSLSTLVHPDVAPADTMFMTSYSPKELRYSSRTRGERAVVFSEIYYPKGWKLTIDDKPADLFRADWILRGAFIPAGEHEIVMRFEPESYVIGERLSRASSIILLLLLLLSGAGAAAGAASSSAPATSENHNKQ